MDEQARPMTHVHARAVLEQITFDENYEFVVSAPPDSFYMRVQVFIDGKMQRGRKWSLSQWMTKSEVVQTAFKAVLTFIEHEVREQFLYRGRPIFGPHFDVDQLVTLCDCKAEDRRG